MRPGLAGFSLVFSMVLFGLPASNFLDLGFFGWSGFLLSRSTFSGSSDGFRSPTIEDSVSWGAPNCGVSPSLSDAEISVRDESLQLSINPFLKPKVHFNAMSAKALKWQGNRVYDFAVSFGLLNTPKADVSYVANPEALVLNLIRVDEDGRAREAVVEWILNPWSSDYGRVKIRTPTGEKLVGSIEPDTSWHRIRVVGDWRTNNYLRIDVDGSSILLREQLLFETKPWSNSFDIYVELGNAWNNCQHTFAVSALYDNIEIFYR